MPKLLSLGAAQQRAATTQTPRRPKGAGGGEERAGQARTTMHAPFKRQVERKMAPSEGLFSSRLPKFESYQLGILNSPAAMLFTLAPPTMLREILATAARWQRRSSDANRLCCAVLPKSAEFPRQYARILIPTD